jgi:hypothetical protein
MRLIPQLGSWLTRPRPCRRPGLPQRAAARLRLEALEGRALPSFGFGWAFGVGGTDNDAGNAVTADASGNLYVTGWFLSSTVNFDPSNTNSNNPNNTLTNPNPGNIDLQFVAKYAPDKTFQWVTLLGRSNEFAGSIAVDGVGNVYAAYVNGGNNTTHGAMLDAGSGAVRWDIPFPGPSSSSTPTPNPYPFAGVAVGPSGDMYVTGTNASSQAFVARLHTDTSGSPVTVWNQPAGGSSTEGLAVAVDSSERVYVAYASGSNINVAKLDASSGGTTWVGTLGSYGSSRGAGIAVDGAGNVYAAGGGSATQKSSFFVAKLTPAASGSLQQSWNETVSGSVYASGIAVDGAGNVYTTGSFTGSVDFDPGSGRTSLTSYNRGKGIDIFVSKLDTNGKFVWAADAVSSPGTNWGHAVAVDTSSPGSPNVYATGGFRTTADFDPTSGTFNLTVNGRINNFGSPQDIFVSKLTQTGPLLAAGARSLTVAAPTLTDAQLPPVVAAAIDRWAAAGLDAADLNLMRHAPVMIADVGGSYLGLADSTTHAIRIDDDAAGHGWFVDPTPRDDREFAKSDGKRVSSRMDLLSVVAHELGHLVGLDDDHNTGHAADVMGDSLSAGVRRTPTATDVPLSNRAEQPAFGGRMSLGRASRHR